LAPEHPLKDGKSFKGSTTIAITAWKAKHGWRWGHPGWLNADKDIDHWWNQERERHRGLVGEDKKASQIQTSSRPEGI